MLMYILVFAAYLAVGVGLMGYQKLLSARLEMWLPSVTHVLIVLLWPIALLYYVVTGWIVVIADLLSI